MQIQPLPEAGPSTIVFAWLSKKQNMLGYALAIVETCGHVVQLVEHQVNHRKVAVNCTLIMKRSISKA